MNPENKNNSGDSAETSKKTTASKLSEAEYLHRQSELAAKAISRTARDLADDLRQLANPVVWTRKYPKTAVGVAMAAGVAAASLAGQHADKGKSADHARQNDPPKDEKSNPALFTMVCMELLAVAKPIISQLLSQAVHSRCQPPDGKNVKSDETASESP